MKQKGEIVIIRDDLSEGVNWGIVSVTPDMLRYKGREAKITSVHGHYYKLDVDNNKWAWTDLMFKEMKDEIIPIKKSTLIKLYNEGCDDVKMAADIISEGRISEWLEQDNLTLEGCLDRFYKDTDDDVTIDCDVNSKLHTQLTLQRDLLAVAYVLNEGWEPDYTNEGKMYFISYDVGSEKIIIEYVYSLLRVGLPAFKSNEIAERAVKIVGGIKRWEELL